MKNKLLKITPVLGLASLLLMMSSCQKKIESAYLNPNAAVKQPIEAILPSVIGGMVYFYSSNGTTFGVQLDGTFIGRYIQYWGTQTNLELYGEMGPATGTTDNTGSMWGSVYYAGGANINKIIQWGSEQQKWDYVGVAWAIRAWGWLELTNEYGDAILKQAFNPSLQQFLYDPQPDFYDSCRAVCFRALSFLNRTDGQVSQANLAIGDAFMNNGDVNKWKKFVYGILARSYNDLSSKDLYNTSKFADSVIKYTNLAMTTNDDNITAKFKGGTISANLNYYGPWRGNIGTLRQGAYIANLMSGRNDSAFSGVADPRAPYMLRENLNGEYRGFTPWLGTSSLAVNDYPQNFWGHPTPSSTGSPTVDNSRYVFQDVSPWPLMTASEMQFTKAEAALKKGDYATAMTAYKNGISLNFDMLTTTYNQNIPAASVITPASKAAYLANPAIVPTNDANLTLSHIMLQKYIALYGWGMQQTWTDMRKYHYTDVDPKTGIQVYASFAPPAGQYLYANNLNKLVYRFRPRYNSEYLYNVPELTRIGAMNLDYNTYEMWFSQK
ncbi:MAG: SusD/RagB family nutrient-binding outer membrane lipoprotein [Bacteroidetes bacterium]|nr:SusD/RagB family nutrient-binding outer membrane lipoprotein [Bacteroidota bacterium]